MTNAKRPVGPYRQARPHRPDTAPSHDRPWARSEQPAAFERWSLSARRFCLATAIGHTRSVCVHSGTRRLLPPAANSSPVLQRDCCGGHSRAGVRNRQRTRLFSGSAPRVTRPRLLNYPHKGRRMARPSQWEVRRGVPTRGRAEATRPDALGLPYRPNSQLPDFDPPSGENSALVARSGPPHRCWFALSPDGLFISTSPGRSVVISLPVRVLPLIAPSPSRRMARPSLSEGRHRHSRSWRRQRRRGPRR
jgi:hypothetical protein